MEGLQAPSSDRSGSRYNSLLWTLSGYSSAATELSGPLLAQVGQAHLPGLGCSKTPSFSTHPTVGHTYLPFCLPTMVPSPLSCPAPGVTALKTRSWGAILVVSQDRPSCLGQAFTYKLGSHHASSTHPVPLTLQCLSSILPPILTIKQQGPGRRAAGSTPRRLCSESARRCSVHCSLSLAFTRSYSLQSPQSDWHLSTVTAGFTPARSI